MEEIVLNKPFITLGQLLKVTGYIDSGAQAKYAVKELSIFVDDVKEDRRGRKLVAGNVVKISDKVFMIRL